MRIAAFNVENLFDRAKALSEKDPALVKKILSAAAELNGIFEKPVYSAADKRRIVQLFELLGLTKRDEGPYVWLRRIRGQIVRRPKTGPVEVVAAGRSSWVGWAELKTAPVNDIAIMNTGRVIRDVSADILAVVEAENRIALRDFSQQILKNVNGETAGPDTLYASTMLIDGNDDRGIDVGLLAKKGFAIGGLRSHIDDRMANGEPVFSRDCPEYEVRTPGGATLFVLPNHFKSKFGGDDALSQAKRKAQAERVAAIYARLKAEGAQNIVIAGDLNDTPDSTPLQPLLATDLTDISAHPAFDTGEFAGQGTFDLGNDSSKIDYMLLSPALFAKVTGGGLFRKGAWPGARPKRWTTYPEVKEKIHAASDHHVIFADIALA
jgi:endonuclease/exonuclease/phosphatase family metal-dependent hydrolase